MLVMYSRNQAFSGGAGAREAEASWSVARQTHGQYSCSAYPKRGGGLRHPDRRTVLSYSKSGAGRSAVTYRMLRDAQLCW